MYETRQQQPAAAARVLFVDDSRVMIYAGRRFLRRAFDVVTAENGREAWELLACDPDIQLVFTDLMMPVMDGHTLIQRIRASREARIRNLPIFVVTGVDEEQARLRALRHGATDVIPKPFSNTDLTEPARLYTTGHDASGRPSGRRIRSHAESEFWKMVEKRAYCVERLDQALNFHRRQNLDLALVHVQLDNFFPLHEDLGPAWAEAALRHVSRILRQEVRLEDTVCRSGSAVFTVILMATDAAGAAVLCRRLERSLAGARLYFANRSLDINVSFAIQAPEPSIEQDADALLQHALMELRKRTAVTSLLDRRPV